MPLGRTRLLILLFTASVLAAVVTFVAFDLWRRHQRAIEAAQTRAASLAAAAAEYVRGTLALADTSLRQLTLHAQRVGGVSADSSEWLPILEAARAASPGLGSISVADARGIIRHSTVAAIVGQSRSTTYLFRTLAGPKRIETLIDEPFLSPLYENRYVLPVGRRLQTASGQFEGVVVSVVTPNAFDEFFQAIDVGAEGIIWVLHPNGVVLAREPSESGALGERAHDNPLVLAARRSPRSGTVHGPLTGSPRTYISAYRSLENPSVIVAVSLSHDEVLADWAGQVRTAIVGLTLFAGTLCGLVFVLFRQIGARSRAERAFEEAQRVEAARLREANERLEDALRRETGARDDAEAASRLKDEFLMTLSHELRTPLNAILGWVRMLLRGGIPDQQREHALGIIERNARAQTHLVEDLLDVSRAITGNLKLDPQPLDLRDVVSAAIETLRPAITAKGIAFHSSVESDLPPMVADGPRLQQVVWNLLSNAIKFTPPGGTVELHVRRIAGEVEIAVRDTGAGIPPSFLPFVFDRFRQADAGPRREVGGLGLGLSIVRHLVELHGGTVHAQSEGEGRGSTFRVRLPGSTLDDARRFTTGRA